VDAGATNAEDSRDRRNQSFGDRDYHRTRRLVGDGEKNMNGLWSILKTALGAATWRRAATPGAVRIRTAIIWIFVAMAAEAARQYVAADGAASFTLYGVNTVIAQAAILVAAGLLVFSADRTTGVAQLFALVVLAECAVMLISSQPVLAAAAALSVAGIAYVSRSRTALFWKLFALIGLVQLAALAIDRLPMAERFDMRFDGWISTAATATLVLVLLIWWTGAIAAALRSDPAYRRPVWRALGLTALVSTALAVLPAYPTFIGLDTSRSSYNLYEWTFAKLVGLNNNTARLVDADTVELAQGPLLEAATAKLLPERKGKPGIYAIGMAGWSDQDVFIKELDGGLAALDKAIGLDRGTIRLVNHPDTVDAQPIANRTNFASAVHAVAKVMDKDEDILLLFITSHGGPTGVGLRLSGAFHGQLSPDHIATVLDREGIKNRLIIISACYSGVFVKRLASPDSVVLTAADENNPSFGCSNERDWTYFGDALFNQNLGAGVSLEDAFDKARDRITEWEKRDALSPSNPQGFFGAELAAKLRARLKPDSARHALAVEP